jgi:hypothetical protein
VPAERLADIASLHPVLSCNVEPPSFRLYFEGDVVRALGALDTFSAGQLTRVLRSAPALSSRQLDLSEVEFVDHRALLALHHIAAELGGIRLRGSSRTVLKVWELLGVGDASELEVA